MPRGISSANSCTNPTLDGGSKLVRIDAEAGVVATPGIALAQFANGRRAKVWLPPSLTARVDPTLHASKIDRLAPITALSVEHVAFDTQKSVPRRSLGWNTRRAPCSATKFGSRPCNKSKDARALEGFFTQDRGRRHRAARNAKACAARDPGKLMDRARWETDRFDGVQQQRKTPLRDAAATNATRWRLYDRWKTTGLPVETGSDGCATMQRIARCLPKEHYEMPCGSGRAPGTVYRPTGHRAGEADQGARDQQMGSLTADPGEISGPTARRSKKTRAATVFPAGVAEALAKLKIG